MQELIARYKLESGLIHYARFCDNIDQVFFEAGDPEGVIKNSKSESVRILGISPLSELHRRREASSFACAQDA